MHVLNANKHVIHAPFLLRRWCLCRDFVVCDLIVITINLIGSTRSAVCLCL